MLIYTFVDIFSAVPN